MDNKLLQHYRQQLSIQESNMEHKIRLDHALRVKDILTYVKNIMMDLSNDNGEKINLSWLYEDDRMGKMITLVQDKLSLFEADTNTTIAHFSAISKQLGKQSALHQIKRQGK